MNTKILSIVALLGFTQVSYGTFILEFTDSVSGNTYITDNGPYDSSKVPGVIQYNGTIDGLTLSVNVSSNNAPNVSKGVITYNSIEYSSTDAVNFSLNAYDDNFTYSNINQPLTLTNSLNGNLVNSLGGTVSFQGYSLFFENPPVTTIIPLNTVTINSNNYNLSLTDSVTLSLASATNIEYELGSIVKFNVPAGSNSNISSNSSVVPDPSWSFMPLFLGFLLIRRK